MSKDLPESGILQRQPLVAKETPTVCPRTVGNVEGYYLPFNPIAEPRYPPFPAREKKGSDISDTLIIQYVFRPHYQGFLPTHYPIRAATRTARDASKALTLEGTNHNKI